MNFAFQGAAGGLDRAAHLRRDSDKIAALWRDARARALPIWRGKVAADGDGLLWLTTDHPVLAHAGTQIFLAIQGDTPLFSVDVSSWQPADGPAPEGGFFDASLQPHPDFPQSAGFVDLRSVMTQLSPADAECAATSKALLTWHDGHGFCPRCGGASLVRDAGWQRHCPACQTPNFPRTDPVVIMLITHQDQLLLGRSPHWPEGMYSLLAGFVEPGETLESAVRREVLEETGVRVGDVRYLASQPWPFPASLMLGCIGTATSTKIKIDPAELQDARWLSRQDVLQVQLGRNPEVKAGRKGAIAQGLIEAWLSGKVE